MKKMSFLFLFHVYKFISILLKLKYKLGLFGNKYSNFFFKSLFVNINCSFKKQFVWKHGLQFLKRGLFGNIDCSFKK